MFTEQRNENEKNIARTRDPDPTKKNYDASDDDTDEDPHKLSYLPTKKRTMHEK